MLNKLLNGKNRIYVLVGGIVLVVLVIILGAYFLSTTVFKKEDSDKIVDQFEKLNNVATEDGKKYPRVNISDYDNLKYISVDGVLDIFENNKDAVIYFGYPTCLYCRTAIQVLVDTAKNTELDTLYYLDVEDLDKKNDDLLNAVGEDFIIDENGTRKIYSPLVVFIANGQIVSYNKGTLFSQEDPYVELDKSQIDGLSEIYRYGIRDVLEGMKN